MFSQKLTRRQVLHWAGGALAASILAACQPKVVEVEKVVKETVIVEGEAKEVTKVVKETVVVKEEVKQEVTRVVEVTRAPTKGIVEFTFIQVNWWGNPPPKDTDFQKEIEKMVGCKLNPIWMNYNDLQTRINLGMASGDLPDFWRLPADVLQLYSATQMKAINEGMVMDLAPVILAPDFKTKLPNLSKIPQFVWDNMLFGGKHIYGIGLHNIPPYGDTLGLRKDLFEKVGFKFPDDLPKTVEEVPGVIGKMVDEPRVFGCAWSTNYADCYQHNYATAFTRVQFWSVDDAGDFIWECEMPEYVDFLKWTKDMYDAGAVPSEFATPGGKGPDVWRNCEAASLTGQLNWFWTPCTWDPESNYGQAGPNCPKNREWWPCDPPKGPKATMMHVNPGIWTQLQANAELEKDPAKVDAWWHLLDVVCTPEYNDFANEGIEGVHWKKNADGSHTTLPKYQEDGVQFWGFALTNWGNSMQAMWDRNEQKWKEVDNEANRCMLAQLPRRRELATLFDKLYESQPEIRLVEYGLNAPTYANKWSELTTELNDHRCKFTLGVESESDWKKYIEGLQKSDIMKAVKEEFKTAYRASK